ncbi:polyprenyl synthetase family protein [Streptomyces hainanensis]|uniref:Polyprenyl synthetase family protein n=1 Tax=Streptomyces hainanensis TaxID=402648 RepID=A0A4R4TKE3_9ACTN|nr:polyprenyl synthetase family protein [Streptomyces hainanensis]TDC75523.1 polyprenyl synthetase family protein [Streptomyces hainanensis]
MIDSTAAGIRERLAEHRAGFDVRFAAYFDALAQRPLPCSDFVPECLGLLRDLSLRGGKRLRVALLHEAAGLVTADTPAGLDEAGLSIELLQTHGLVHDDIIDDSPTRRGGPSVHHAYRQRLPNTPHTALGLAVLAGDLAAFLSVQVLLEAKVPAALRLAMAEVQLATGADTVIGQILDLERDFHHLPDRAMLDAVSDHKTARYSVLAPLRLGLLAAGEDIAAHDARLRRYATLVGISGTLRDDYLDLFGDPEVLGKPAGSDLREGRRTYAVCAVLAAATPTERDTVEEALAAPDCPPDTVDAVRRIALRHGVDDRLREDILGTARAAAAEAASWRPHWRADAVAFFEHLPLWGAERTR